ncbi:MAG: histidine kinase [Armatimonadetes bacterium]|nr:histidine kinase [Armatimonadota bacterium]
MIGQLPGCEEVARCVRYHRERYDGGGHHGLVGETTPVGARIIAVADALDAMLSPRPYRPALAPEAALAEIESHAGQQFDPRMVRALVEVARTDMGNAPVAGQAAGGMLRWPAVTDN